jgi:hypothetical protein
MYDFYLTNYGNKEVKKYKPENAYRIWDLIPVYNGQKSYYGKAKVMENIQGEIILISYWTEIAKITKEGLIPLWINYSATTSRHLQDFLYQYGLKGYCKKEWLSLEHGEKYQVEACQQIFKTKETA